MGQSSWTILLLGGLVFQNVTGRVVSSLSFNDVHVNDPLHLMESRNSGQCDEWYQTLAQSWESVTVPNPLNIRGKWVSENCEVRPGPKFLLRRYLFHGNHSFVLQQFYYTDDSCTLPAYSVSAWSRYHFRRPSWVVPGGIRADYMLHKVTVMPYTTELAEALFNKINRTCPAFAVRNAGKTWRPYKKYRIYSYVEAKRGRHRNEVEVLEDMDCLAALHLSFHELQLVRLESRNALKHKHLSHGTRMELLLGDIHSQQRQRIHYRPTSYQSPLLKAEAPGCHICHIVSKSNEQSPPQLPSRAKLPVYLSGEWISRRCEVRPLGMFLTRRMKFFGDNETWIATYQYFRDPLCTSPTFRLVASGEYASEGPSLHLPGGTNYDFYVHRASITPQDDHFVSNANGLDGHNSNCGRKGSWKVNVTQEVTSSGGCIDIGLVVPSIEYEVVRMDIDHYGNALLFMGQVDTDLQPSERQRRPTSYQVPLIQCSVFADYFLSPSHHNNIFPVPYAQLGLPANTGEVHDAFKSVTIILVLTFAIFRLAF